MAAPSQHISHKLTRLAIPLIPTHGFTASSLSIASSSLSSTPNSPPLDSRTIDALYPSPPANVPSPNAFSLKGLAIGNGGKRSLSRQELISLARGRGTVEGTNQAEREKTGPARALVKAWLEEGRIEMVKAVKGSGLRGESALRRGIRARLEYNENVLDKLPEVSSTSGLPSFYRISVDDSPFSFLTRFQALALLSASTTTPLSSPTSMLPFLSPIPHFSHVASIAQDLAKASGSQAQGVSLARILS